MTGLSQFLAMGGYGAFVWPAYGIAAVVLGAVYGVSRLGLRRAESALRALDEALDDVLDQGRGEQT